MHNFKFTVFVNARIRILGMYRGQQNLYGDLNATP